MDTLNLPARLDSLTAFNGFVLERAEQAGASQELLDDIKLWLEEILTNIFFYAYPDQEGQVEVSVSAQSGRRLRIDITDWGLSFDPLAFDIPDLKRDFAERESGGMGIHLARTLSHQMVYERTRDANHVTVFFLVGSKAGAMDAHG
jgi:anti-sigma regulatory factor (Ser/Thr protein kinase)